MDLNELIVKELIKSRVKNPETLASFKRRIAKKDKIPCPSNIQLLTAYHRLVKKGIIKKFERIQTLLKTRPVRSLSGIVNVSVLTKPYPCPGKCLYCPAEKGVPKSYLSGEPAVERAKRLNYDPYLQVKKRVEILGLEGHPTDKIEVRIVGGTWSYYPKKYQNWFVKRCFDAANGKMAKNLEGAQRLNEKAGHRIVGLSIETRPDFINLPEIKWLRRLGVTMVELGVQTIYDNVLKRNLRGHGVRETILATKLLKDAGFKILYQMMLNLPGSNFRKDIKMFKELFSSPDFQPDLLKIYPCALLKEAPLYKLWRNKKYKPYSKKQLIALVTLIKKGVPYYVRIQRITRDIPSPKIVEGGAKILNLRQVLAGGMSRKTWQCKCIRCREIKDKYNPKEKIYLFRENYNASGGKEIFLSLESKNREKLYSLLRLRIPSQRFQKEKGFLPVLGNSAIIREVHTYGQLVPLATKKIAPQHRGLGKRLIKKAEEIARRDFGLKNVAVISGVGARNYFTSLGYKLNDTYMVKRV